MNNLSVDTISTSNSAYTKLTYEDLSSHAGTVGHACKQIRHISIEKVCTQSRAVLADQFFGYCEPLTPESIHPCNVHVFMISAIHEESVGEHDLIE